LISVCCDVTRLQAYRQSGKPVEVLSEAERFVMSLMDVPRATPRLRAFALKFTAAEKAAEATAVFRVRHGCCVILSACVLSACSLFSLSGVRKCSSNKSP
jgi:hypothetical protein